MDLQSRPSCSWHAHKLLWPSILVVRKSDCNYDFTIQSLYAAHLRYKSIIHSHTTHRFRRHLSDVIRSLSGFCLLIPFRSNTKNYLAPQPTTIITPSAGNRHKRNALANKDVCAIIPIVRPAIAVYTVHGQRSMHSALQGN